MNNRAVDVTQELFAAIKEKNVDLSNYYKIVDLLNNGADLSAKQNHLTPAQLAGSLKNWLALNAFANSTNNLINENDKFTFGYPIHDAVIAGEYATVKKLLKAGGSQILFDVSSGHFPLHQAVSHNSPLLAQLLLEHGGDQTVANKKNQTPVELASEKGHWDIVRFLVKVEKNPDKDRKKALHWKQVLWNAIKQNDYFMVEFMLAHGASCKAKNNEMGNIALYLAIHHADKGDPGIIKLLLDHGADPDVKNKQGQNSYAMAAAKEDITIFPNLFVLLALSEHYHRKDIFFVKKYGTDTTKLFRDICEYAIKPEELHTAIHYLNECHRKVLEKMRDGLSKIRDEIGNNQVPGVQLDSLSRHISVINQLINCPDNPVPQEFFSDHHTPEAEYIAGYLEQKAFINDYKAKIINYFIDLIHDMAKAAKENKWKIKLFGFWIDGLPYHASRIFDNAKKINDPASDPIQLYSNVIQILQSIVPSDDRHPYTHDFYARENINIIKIAWRSLRDKEDKKNKLSTHYIHAVLSTPQPQPVINIPVINIPVIERYVPPPIIVSEHNGEHSDAAKVSVQSTPKIYPVLDLNTDPKINTWSFSNLFPRVPEQSLLTRMLPNVPVPNDEIELQDFSKLKQSGFH